MCETYSSSFIRKILSDNGLLKCELIGCGFEDVVELAHVVPRKDGGVYDIDTNLLILCPNHHAMFDRGILKINPKKIIKHRGWKFSDLIRPEERKQVDEEYRSKIEKCEQVLREREEILKTVDTSQRGWVTKLSKKWNLSRRQTRRFMSKYFPDEDSKALKGKTPILTPGFDQCTNSKK